MCKELCENDDFGPQSCQDCGMMICFDVKGGDDILRPAFVTSEGDLFCDSCGRAQERRIEEAEECDPWDEYDPYEDFVAE